MEGFLVRLPTCAWNVDDDATATKARKRRSRRSCKPQARLLYYILGEGYLEGFASPDDMEPVESFQLTSFEVDVDPVYSMLMFKVSTHEKKSIRQPSPPVAHGQVPSDSSDDEGHTLDHGTPSTSPASAGSNLLFFAGSKLLVELWCKKLVNWNRYVFAGAQASVEECDLIQAKAELINAFHEKNNQGMFSVICQLQDCSTPLSAEAAPLTDRGFVDSVSVVTAQQFQPPPLPLPMSGRLNTKLEDDANKPAATKTEIKPLWMLLNRGSSRRIRSVPMSK